MSALPSPIFIDVEATLPSSLFSVGSQSFATSKIRKIIPMKATKRPLTLEELLQGVKEKATPHNCYEKDLQAAKEQDMFKGLLVQITTLIQHQNDDLEKKRKRELQNAVKHLVEHLRENCGYEYTKQKHECAVCLEKYGKKGYAFDCGHLICETCSPRYQYYESYGYCCHTCKKYTVGDLKLVYF